MTAPTTPSKGGTNNRRLASTISLVPLDGFRANFMPYNFKSTGDGGQAGTIFSQIYILQTMQELLNQPLYVRTIAKGYASPTYGPVPLDPPNPYVNKLEKFDPYPYSPTKATALLRSHGWKVMANHRHLRQRHTAAQE